MQIRRPAPLRPASVLRAMDRARPADLRVPARWGLGGSSCDAAGATMAPNLQIRRTAPYLRHDFDKRRTPTPRFRHFRARFCRKRGVGRTAPVPPATRLRPAGGPPAVAYPAAPRLLSSSAHKAYGSEGLFSTGRTFGTLRGPGTYQLCALLRRRREERTFCARRDRPRSRWPSLSPRFRQPAASDATVPTNGGPVLSRSWRRFTGARPSANRIRVVVEKRLRVWRFRRCFCKPKSIFRCKPASVCRRGLGRGRFGWSRTPGLKMFQKMPRRMVVVPSAGKEVPKTNQMASGRPYAPYTNG